MIKKEPADWVFFNVNFKDNNEEAIAIYESKVIAIGSIPYIFSNYRGFKDYNGQGNSIGHIKSLPIKTGENANGIAVYVGNQAKEETIVWEVVNGICISKNTNLLDEHWDDH